MIELTGTFTIAIDSQAARIVAEQRHLVVDVDDPRAFLQAIGGPSTGRSARSLDALRQAGAVLARAGLTVRIVSRGASLVVLGHDARPGLTQALTGSPHVALGSPLGLLRLLGS